MPGQESFTSALIYALETLSQQKKEGRFTTVELLRTIKDHAPHFPKDQDPILSERGNMHAPAGRIMLHPLRRDGTMSQIPNEMDLAKKHTVTLHFDFGEKPSEGHLETLGRDLNGIFERNSLEVHRVRWGGMRASMIARAASGFQAPLRERRASQREERAPLEARLAPQTPQLASSPSSNLLSPPATGYHTQDSPGTNTTGFATSSQSLSADSSEDLESRRKSRRKRRKAAQNDDSTS